MRSSRAAFPPGGHDHKALVEILETYPRDELFQIPEDELFEIAMGILGLGERQRVKLFVRRDEYERFVSCLLFLPRDRFNTQNRERATDILAAAFNGESVDFELCLAESVLVRIHLVVHTRPSRRSRGGLVVPCAVSLSSRSRSRPSPTSSSAARVTAPASTTRPSPTRPRSMPSSGRCEGRAHARCPRG
jgi:Bacterial NAD-glutamate dehydrogenase